VQALMQTTVAMLNTGNALASMGKQAQADAQGYNLDAGVVGYDRALGITRAMKAETLRVPNAAEQVSRSRTPDALGALA